MPGFPVDLEALDQTVPSRYRSGGWGDRGGVPLKAAMFTCCLFTNHRLFTSNCQWAACSSCLACSLAHPAANTNWLIITCSLNPVSMIDLQQEFPYTLPLWFHTALCCPRRLVLKTTRLSHLTPSGLSFVILRARSPSHSSMVYTTQE